MQNKYTIQMDLEGMQEALQPYDGLVIEAEDEDEAEKILLKKIKEDGVSPLPYFGISGDEQEPRITEPENINKPLALARGQWLQGSSVKLQATSSKLDKKTI